MDRLKGKTAIITGASSGIGEGIAKLFAEEGAKLALFDIKGCPIAEEIKSKGGVCYYHQVDVSSEEQVKTAIEEAVNELGKIDILVNNAGIPGANKPTHLIEEKEWDKVFDIDVKGVLFCSKHAIPLMIANGGGSIINLSSVYAICGSMGDISIYHAAKAAVASMSRQDACTYGRKGVRVNAILPGTVATPLMENLTKDLPGGWEGYKAYIAKHNPMNKIAEPIDIAYGALYLASDESRFVNGIELVIDGGYSAW